MSTYSHGIAPTPRPFVRATEQLSGRALARARGAAMRQRASGIRRSVAVFTVAIFSAAFLAVYVQLASGHDPALAANSKRAVAHVAAKATQAGTAARESTGSSTSTGPGGEKPSSGSSSASEEETSESVASVTTSQS